MYAKPNFVSPSDNNDVVLTSHDSSFPLAQWMGLEVGEPFGVVAEFSVVDACFESEDTLDAVDDLVEVCLEGSCDLFQHKESHSHGCPSDLLNPLDCSHAYPLSSLPSHSLECYIDVPISSPTICGAAMDLGYENMFSMVGRNVDDYVFLGYFRG